MGLIPIQLDFYASTSNVRHCERSEAIQQALETSGLLRFARNDERGDPYGFQIDGFDIRRVPVALCTFAMLCCLLAACGSRSVDATVSNKSVLLRYTVNWDWEISESITFVDVARPDQERTVSSKIVKKPYLSGALIYSEDDNDHIDVKLGQRASGQLFRFSTKTRALTSLDLCGVIASSPKARDHIDPRWSVATGPRPSHYFPGRLFLGAFGSVGSSRDGDVKFTPAETFQSEPPLDEGECP